MILLIKLAEKIPPFTVKSDFAVLRTTLIKFAIINIKIDVVIFFMSFYSFLVFFIDLK